MRGFVRVMLRVVRGVVCVVWGFGRVVLGEVGPKTCSRNARAIQHEMHALRLSTGKSA